MTLPESHPLAESRRVIGPTFEIEIGGGETRTHIAVRGEIDIKSAPELESALSEATGDPVILDLSEVTFIDSTGLRVLVMERARIESEDGSLVLCAPGDSPVLRTMRLAGLAPDFQVVASPDELPG